MALSNRVRLLQLQARSLRVAFGTVRACLSVRSVSGVVQRIPGCIGVGFAPKHKHCDDFPMVGCAICPFRQGTQVLLLHGASLVSLGALELRGLEILYGLILLANLSP